MSRDQECQEKKKKELKDVEKAKLEEPEEDKPILEEEASRRVQASLAERDELIF